MGGMQVLEFCAQFPDRYDNLIAVAATAKTSPSTIALRSTQRMAVRQDPKYNNGHYGSDGPSRPIQGMGLARRMGMMTYRSREEFDARFSWDLKDTGKFEVEEYLEYH